MRSPTRLTLARRNGLPLVLGLALAYFLLGRLSLYLAIPPGFASSVWPAAGVALMALLLGGGRLWPGVLLGSFLVNFSTTLGEPAGVGLLRSAAVPAAIGAGAALQAWLGAWAARRWAGFPVSLSHSSRLFRFLALAGPVSCLVSPTVAVAGLRVAGLIAGSETIFQWWTWWVGDTIGVLVLAPMALAFTSEPRGVWRDRFRRVALPLLVGAATVVLLFFYARRQERRQLDLEAGQRALALAHAFEKHIDRSIDDVMSIEGLFAADPRVSRRAFGRFARRILERNPTFQALSWNPRVPQGERPAFEAAGREDGFLGYRFTEATGEGLVPAAARPEYVVVHYIEPYAGNQRALGFDIASNANRRTAIEQARDSGRPAATAGIRLVQETHRQTGVLILMPVYAAGARPGSVAERRGELRGFATGVLRLADALQTALDGLPRRGFQVTLVDRSAPEPGTVLASLEGGHRRYGKAHLSWEFERQVGGRTWSLRLDSTPDLLADHRRWYAWLVLAGGLVMVSLLGVLLLLQSGRASELAVLNEQLRQGMDRRRRLEDRQRRLIGELELRNAELERFSYSISHDLKSPLITIKGYLGLLERDLAAGRLAEVDAELDVLRQTADQMRDLVADLLDLSRAGHATGPTEVLSLEALARQTVERLSGSGAAAGMRFELALGAHEVRANHGQVLEVLDNLLDNAVKFMGGQRQPRIEIGARAEAGRVVCHVRDNGIGVEAAHHERIFGLFSRLDPARDGRGVGLALVRRIVETHGGSVWVESEGAGHGSAVFFTLPAA